MGNFSSKENHGAAGGHPDIFHTPPTSPTTDVPTTLQLKCADSSLPPLVAPMSCPPPVPAKTPLQQFTRRKSQPGIAPTTPTPPPDWKPPIPPASPMSLKSLPASPKVQVAPPPGCNGGPSTSTPAPRAQGSQRRGGPPSPARSPVALDPAASPDAGRPDRDWRERDSGLSQSPTGSCPTREGQREEMETTLEQCRTTLGITPDGAPSTTELLKCLLTEINGVRTNLQTERNEWLQFQTDLQVAVAVADRLRAEAEEELLALRGAHKETERELAAAHQRQREADTQLETLRGELSESRQKLAAVPQVHGKTQAQALSEVRERPDSCANNRESLRGTERGRTRGLHGPGQEGTENGSPNGTAALSAVTKGEETKTDSRGVARRYIRNVTSEGVSKEMSRTNETRRTGTTERSRSLSRIAISLDSHVAQNGTSQSNAGTTASYTNKNSNQPRVQRSLDWPESSSANAGKREELLNKYNSALSELPPTKSQDGFNTLLRRHGGSKRNSLLRWCQNRTLGYKNIDLTNFSSSWADGLAFCAVYHTYLPSHVPYATLNPEDKRENLNLAFKTGENVGITRSLTVEEMLRAGGPDWQRVLSYVESMYRHFEM